jgi:hypothetical protein
MADSTIAGPIERLFNGAIILTSFREFTPTCPLCNQLVGLETCKIDEQGRAVHEDCYARKVAPHHRPQQPLESE